MRGIQTLFENFIAGENLSAEELVYFSANRTVSKADASDADKMPCIGITIEAATAGNSISVLTFGTFEKMQNNVFTGNNTRLFVSSTNPGEITETSPADTGGLEQTIGIATTTDGMLFRPTFQDECEIDNVWYVGKHGSDQAGGNNACDALLTIGEAVTRAVAATPSSSNIQYINIVDSGIYNENISLTTSWIDIFGAEARVTGNLVVTDNNFVRLNELVSTTGNAIQKTTGTDATIVVVGKVISSSTGSAVLNTSTGILNVEIEFLEKTNGVGIGATAGTLGIIHADVQDFDYIDATAIYHPGGENINFRSASMFDRGGTTTAFNVQSGGNVIALVSSVAADTLYNVASGGLLDLVAGAVSGTRISATRQDITVAGERWPQYHIYADQFRTVRSSDWAVNTVAPLAADSTNSAILCRRFDDTTEEGVGYELVVPPQATYATLGFRGRAQTAPGATSGVAINLYYRLLPNGAAVPAWSAQVTINFIQVPTDAFYRLYETRDTLTNLGLTAGSTYQIEITRDADVAYDSLTGDFNLAELFIIFD